MCLKMIFNTAAEKLVQLSASSRRYATDCFIFVLWLLGQSGACTVPPEPYDSGISISESSSASSSIASPFS